MSILITQLVAYRKSLTAVYGVEQTNPLHYALQVMHATGLVCSNGAVYNVLSKRSCQDSILQKQATTSFFFYFLPWIGTINQAFSSPLANVMQTYIWKNIFLAVCAYKCDSVKHLKPCITMTTSDSSEPLSIDFLTYRLCIKYQTC